MGRNNRLRRFQKKQKKEKQKKLPNKRRGIKNQEPIGPVLQMVQNPFGEMSDSDRKQVLREIAKSSEDSYVESISKVKDILHQYDPTILLSVLASYGLTVHVGDEGIQTRDSELKIHQAHLEICQAFALQIQESDLVRKLFGPDVVQELWDALIELMRSLNYRGMADRFEEDIDKKTIGLLQHLIRGNTQMVRNWGYFSQVKNISRELYMYFDSLLKETYGFSADNILSLFEYLIVEVENRNSERYTLLRVLYSVKEKKEMVYKYYELIGQTRDDADRFINVKEFETAPRKNIFFMLLSHYDLRLPDNYTFSPDYLSDRLNIDVGAIRNILDEYSYSWGDLGEYETEYLYLSNPVWLCPVIKLDAEKYFCVFPQVFFSFVIPSVEKLIENINKQKLSERRAEYLEGKIVEIINRRFPESNTIAGVKWKLDVEEYETDLITFIDSHAIIVEAKSGRISDPALRGAPDRLKKHIDQILIAPNIQSKRLKERLEQLIANPEIEDTLRDKLPIDLNEINRIIRVSVSLEDFGSIQANIMKFKETGWLPADFKSCPTMNLADFETLFDFLEHPVQIIHYLERRQELEAKFDYMGDELDLMGMYIGTLFNTGDLESDVNIIISEMSSPLDAYYNSKDAGVLIPKPKPKVSELFTEILKQLEQRKTPRWTEIGVLLHRFSPDDQRKLTKMIKHLMRNVRKKWMIDGHKNTAVYIPPKASEYALSYVVYNDTNANRRNDFVHEAARYGLEAEHVKECLVIAKNMDKKDLSYHFIGLYG